MAEVDENLKTFLQTDAAIARKVGIRVHENHVPMRPDGEFNTAVPFIYFVQTGEIRDDCLDDTVGADPTGYQFALEVVAQSLRDSRTIAGLVIDRLHLATGTFGSQTIQVATCEGQSDDYQERSGATDRGFHTSAFQVEVYP